MARLWRWREGTLACPPLPHAGGVVNVAFTADGRWLLTSTSGGPLRLWQGETGKPIAPAIPLLEGGLQLLVPPDGRRVLVVGLSRVSAFHLGMLAEGQGEALDDESRILLGEILAGQRIHEEGAGVANLASEEWLERWRAFRRRHPGHGAVDFSPGALRAWHHRQADVRAQERQLNAAAWHLERLGALGEDIDPGRLAVLDEFVRAWRIAPVSEPWLDLKNPASVDAKKLEAIEAGAAAEPLVKSGGPFVDFLRRFPAGTDMAAYAARTITCERAWPVRILAGSDDGIRLWLNGEEIYKHIALRPAVPDQDVVTATLRPGENRLLVEVSQAYGSWGFYLRLEDEQGRKLRLKDDGTLEPLEGAR
jgi:hypothetical protein